LPEAALAAQVLAARPGEAALLLSPDRRSLRVSLLIETLDAAALDALEAELMTLAQANLPKAVSVSITGSYPLLLRAQRSLLYTLKASLITTLLLMEVVLVGFLGGLKVALVALLPNVVPVALNFVVMAALGIPVDLGTAMTAAVALGIAVDDTLHVAVAFAQGPPKTLAARCGRGVVLSSVVVGLGFLALTTSDFGPTRSFGLLAGFAMLTALWGDLVMLPPLLSRLGRRGGR
jgi:predicted RND superfamily exporter protein